MVAAPARAVVDVALDERRAAEFAAPDHQRVVEQAALLQILRPGPPTAGRCRGTGCTVRWSGCCAGPSRRASAARTARRARPAGGPSGSCRRTCPAACTSGPYMSSVAGDSSEKSVSSGTLACIRYAISYWAMRVAISGSPKSCSLHFVQLGEIVEHARGAPRGSGRRDSTGTAPDRRCRGT